MNMSRAYSSTNFLFRPFHPALSHGTCTAAAFALLDLARHICDTGWLAAESWTPNALNRTTSGFPNEQLYEQGSSGIGLGSAVSIFAGRL